MTRNCVDLIAASGGKWIFIGMESLDPANLASVNKSFNKPGEYAAVLQRLAQRNVYAITSFIFGLDNDTAGVAERTLEQIRRGRRDCRSSDRSLPCRRRRSTPGWRPRGV